MNECEECGHVFDGEHWQSLCYDCWRGEESVFDPTYYMVGKYCIVCKKPKRMYPSHHICRTCFNDIERTKGKAIKENVDRWGKDTLIFMYVARLFVPNSKRLSTLCYKIGIAKDIKKRFYGFSSYEPELLYAFKQKSPIIAQMEYTEHLKHAHMLTIQEFDGGGECYTDILWSRVATLPHRLSTTTNLIH